MPEHPYLSEVVFSWPATSSFPLHPMLASPFSPRRVEPHYCAIHVVAVTGFFLPHGQSFSYRGSPFLVVVLPQVRCDGSLFPDIISQNFGWWYVIDSHASGYAVLDNFHRSMQQYALFQSLRALLLHIAFSLWCYLR